MLTGLELSSGDADIYMRVLDVNEWRPGILANLAFRLISLHYSKLDSSHISGYVELIRDDSTRWPESDGSARG